MSKLPYQREDDGDASMIPLNHLRPPSKIERLESYNSANSDVNPPPHRVHPHGFSNEHYYQGFGPGDQGDATEEVDDEDDHDNHDNHDHDDEANGSRSWSGNHQYDTLVDGEKRGAFASQGESRDQQHRQNNHHHHHSGTGHSDSEDETDDFDWDTSDEEGDLHDDTKRIRAKRGRKLYLALMRLARPVRLFAIGFMGTVVALIPFIVVLAAFRQSPARDEVETWSIWIAIIWAAGCGTFIAVDLLPPIVLKMGIAFYGKAPATFKTGVEVLIAVKLWLKLVLCIAWAWISLGGVTAISFSASNRPRYFSWVFRVLQAVFGTLVLVLAEKVLLQIVAINFHKTALKDRLEKNRSAIKALDALHESKYLASGNNSGRHTGQWSKPFGWVSGSRPGSPGPNTPSRIVHAAKPSRDVLESPKAHKKETQTPQNDKEARKTNFANQLTDALATATLKGSKLYRGKGAKSQLSARRLAKKLFMAIGHHRQTLIAEDFFPFFTTPEEAKEAFKHFDADNNGDISKKEMRDAVQNIYRERRSLTTQLKDMSSAVSKLDGVLLGIVLIIVIFLWLLIFNGSNTVANIAPLSTFVVSFSFIFGNSAKTLFESMIFIFATHPYDVGDLVCVDDNFMFVTSFGLISTTFKTVVNEYMVLPNSLLATQKMIYNCRRSGSQWEVTYIQVGYDSTLLEMIDDLRTRMREWVKSRDREWTGNLDININELQTSTNAVELTIAFEHKTNWQAWGDRWARRTLLMRQVKTACEELGIKYQNPVQPVTFHRHSGSPSSANEVSPTTGGPRNLGRGKPLPVGGIGNRQYTRAEAIAIKKSS